MFELTEEQKSDDLVKSLLEGGFAEEVVAGWIQSGAVTIEKSVQSGPDDHGEGDGDGNHEKREDYEKDKKKGKKKDDEEDEDLEKGRGCASDKPDEIAKSLGIDVLLKSIGDDLAKQVEELNEEFAKSIPDMVSDALKPLSDMIEKSLNGMREAITAFGNQAPGFKGADMSRAIIEKSIENGGGAKDDLGKTALSVSRDRTVVRELIQKSIDEETNPEIQKSLRVNSEAYILDPVYGTVGEPVARYLYDHKGVRLVK